ncbi:MAG TPA: hypothetical protein PK858_01445, partial [Saprospiraceae bacterium]|nr:hypothetical protein [Saprospiraceae bacterium]
YTLNLHYFLWDCAAIGAVLAAASYVVFYSGRFRWLVDLGWAGNVGLLLGLGLMGFLGWYFSMQGWRKYRFIHAVAQFQQYFADDQWIALAEDVFPSPLDPYLQELRSQCTYQGFGLAIVPAEGKVRLLISPSRLSIFGKDRSMIQWVTRAQWYRNATQGLGTLSHVRPPDALTAVWNKVARPVRHLLFEPLRKAAWSALAKPFALANSPYTRFMRGRPIQRWIFGVALVAISPLFYQVVTVREEEVADLDALRDWKEEGRNPEDQPGYVIDGSAIPYDGRPTGVPKQYPLPAQQEEEEVSTIDLSGEAEEAPSQALPAPDPMPSRTQPAAPSKRYEGIEYDDETAASPTSQTLIKKPISVPLPQSRPDPCSRFDQVQGWVIQEATFERLDYAQERVALLRRRKIAAESVAHACLDLGASGYVVLLGGIYSEEGIARDQMAAYRRSFLAQGLGKPTLVLRSLRD